MSELFYGYELLMHPILVMNEATKVLSFTTQPINTGTQPNEFEEILTELNSKMEQYDYLTNAAITAYKLENDTNYRLEADTIIGFQDRGKREIIKSALDEDFVKDFVGSKNYKKAEELLQLVIEIIGIESPREKQESASKKLREATRQIAKEEKFEQFLRRLNHIAENISENKEIQKYLVEAQFDKNLTNENQDFLRDHGKDEEQVCNIAQFLDAKLKHKKHQFVPAQLI